MPYFRRAWRLSFVTVCAKHLIDLHDRCPRCGSPVVFHRLDFSDRNRPSRSALYDCPECGADLREAPRVRVRSGRDAAFLLGLLEMLSRGHTSVPGYGPIYSHLFFDILYQFAKLLSLSRRGHALRGFVEKELGNGNALPPTGTRDVGGKSFEHLALTERRRVVTCLAWLFEDWPARFVRACRESGVTRSVALQHMEAIPYWFEMLCADRLEAPKHSPSEDEILSAQAYLRRRGEPCGPSLVSSLLGLSGSKKVSRVLRAVRSSSPESAEPSSDSVIAGLASTGER